MFCAICSKEPGHFFLIIPLKSLIQFYLFQHSARRIECRTLTYDCNGNMITRTISGGASSNLTYDGENRLTQVISGTLTANFSYDGGGGRVKSVIGGVTTVFIGGYYDVKIRSKSPQIIG